ncbi:MAG TPA: D-alanyl-D-alanine carboxypeptidase [Alphaproteobacteria bacterium]|nr:D-alanyl-D-alanine carboxypeptidase [Alphaproteobacteria bacterium]
MKKTLLLAFLALLIFKSSNVMAETSSIMVDAQSGDVLYAHNADQKRYPASLTKLMTLYITFNALENGNLKMDDKLKTSYTAASRSPSRLGLNHGDVVDVKTCILASIIKSANDCATILGEALSNGNEREFAKMMTKTAQKLGMKNTTFKNASGLNHSEQKSTARDMAILALALYHHFPQYYSLFSLTEFEYQGQIIQGHNNLLKTFDGADGLKTGYTANAGFNIVTSAKRGNHRVFVVTMGHKTADDRDEKVASMMNTVFNRLSSNKKIDVQQLRAEIETPKGGQTRTMLAQSNISVTPKAKPASDFAIRIGAFSSYDKAFQHASAVQKQYSSKLQANNIQIEKLERAGKPLYRAQIAGLNKTDASKLCTALQNKKQECVAALIEAKTQFAER